MTVLQTTQYFLPEINLEYDEAKERYIGRVWSRSGFREFEGPDKNSVMIEIDTLLREEYHELMRSLEQEKGQEAAPSRSAGAAESNSVQPEPQRRTTRLGRWVRTQGAVMALSSALPDFTIAATALEVVSGLFSLLLGRRGKRFKVMFNGVMITAATRRLLLKKLSKERQKHLNRIMSGIITTKKNALRIDSVKKAQYVQKRIRVKRKKAIARAPQSWERRMGSKAKANSWEERTERMQMRINEKRQSARDLWVHR